MNEIEEREKRKYVEREEMKNMKKIKKRDMAAMDDDDRYVETLIGSDGEWDDWKDELDTLRGMKLNVEQLSGFGRDMVYEERDEEFDEFWSANGEKV